VRSKKFRNKQLPEQREQRDTYVSSNCKSAFSLFTYTIKISVLSIKIFRKNIKIKQKRAKIIYNEEENRLLHVFEAFGLPPRY
jgi:hypothetical protein